MDELLRALRTAGELDRARALAREDVASTVAVGSAWAEAYALHALALVEDDLVREQLRVAGARPRRARISGRDALTPSELRICRMASTGMTNREIAQALFVSLRTVETHLTRSYAKLGVGGREGLREVLDGVAGLTTAR